MVIRRIMTALAIGVAIFVLAFLSGIYPVFFV